MSIEGGLLHVNGGTEKADNDERAVSQCIMTVNGMVPRIRWY